jgi:hypothetical protein
MDSVGSRLFRLQPQSNKYAESTRGYVVSRKMRADFEQNKTEKNYLRQRFANGGMLVSAARCLHC